MAIDLGGSQMRLFAPVSPRRLLALPDERPPRGAEEIAVSIEIFDVSKRFDDYLALDRVSLEVQSGELLALLGPSGSGKTTLLRIMAGLERPDSGGVRLHGEDAVGRGPRERQVGFVFQHYALFRHMSVFDNVAFGLSVRPRSVRPSKAEIAERVHRLLSLVQLDWVGDRYPSQLSGGQRQRVALARALAIEPKVLLLDEPFGALDAKVRKELRRWLRRLHDEMHITSVFVTHDQEEALEVADRVVIMNEGRVEQIGTPAEVYDHPATPFVYHFLGNVNLFHGRIHEGRARIGEIELEAPEHADARDIPAVGYVRPHDIEVTRSRNGTAAIEATISYIHPIGPLVHIELTSCDSGNLIEVALSKDRYQELRFQEGERVFITPRKLRVFAQGGQSVAGEGLAK